MKTSLKAGFAQIFSCWPKNLSCPKFGGAAAPLAPPARTPMGGNPTPSVEWRLKGRKLLSGAKYLVRDGELVVRNLNYNDTGQYTCAEKNTLGSSDAFGNLTVPSKKNIFFSTVNNRLNKTY